MQQPDRKLLIVEDDPGLQSQLRWCFEGYEVLVAEDRKTALMQLRRHEPPVVTLDLGLPPDPANPTEGFATLEEIMAIAPATKVIVVTGNDERQNALRAVALGAYDFYAKPIDAAVLQLIIDRAYKLARLEQENRDLGERVATEPLQGIIAASAPMLKVCRTISKIAPTDATVLLHGESGTGKELLARALHELSGRIKGEFVAINCAAIPENLLESELFGYEKGAFTGAVKQTKGKIEYADGGTLFLDEIGDLPLALQVKLLRFLQERLIERVGGRQPIPVDVRVICATHQHVPSLIKEERFREDLYYRISAITVEIPPLREREGDAILLARALLERLATQLKQPPRGFSKEALAALSTYAWPGNVRELANKIERAVILCEGGLITADDLELTASEEPVLPLNLRQVRERAERQALVQALAHAEGNLSQAADLLGITRPTLYTLLNKYQLKAT